MQYALDPASFLEAHSVQLSSAAVNTGTFDLDAAEWIDIAQYEHVVLACANSGGTGTILITPRESDSQGGTEYALDGTGGLPDNTVSFAGSDFTVKHSIIRTRGRRRYLNVQVVIGTAAARPMVTLYGIRKYAGTGQNLTTALTPLQVS